MLCSMSNVDRTLRIHEINTEARELGYRIELEMITPQSRTPAHRAFAYRLDDEQSGRRFLCGGTDVLDVLEDGLEVLRGVVKEGHGWPGGEPREG
jgi:hypothetical protein